MTTNIFETATRAKLRFETPKGLLSVEDLWDLPLTNNKGGANLDDIARGLHRILKDDDVSFVTAKKTNEGAKLKFDVVKHIIDIRLEENAVAEDLANRKARKSKLLAILADKEDEALKQSSIEELKAEIQAM